MQLDDRHRALLKQVHDDLKAKSDMTSQVGGTTFGIVTTPILRGQQACAHPSVLLHQQQAVASTSTAASGAGGKKRKTSSDLDLTSIPPCHRFECILSDIMTAITTPRPSNPDEFCKAIVVCKFITELQLYEHLLNERLAKRFPTVEGETPHKVRILTGRGRDQVDKMLEQFEHNFFVPVLLMQFQSGTEALNLQRGNHVFFPSPLWNPFTMMQAIARCHRIGQKDSPVKVKIYWSSGTIEEYIKDKNQLKVDMVVDFLNDPSVSRPPKLAFIMLAASCLSFPVLCSNDRLQIPLRWATGIWTRTRIKRMTTRFLTRISRSSNSSSKGCFNHALYFAGCVAWAHRPIMRSREYYIRAHSGSLKAQDKMGGSAGTQ